MKKVLIIFVFITLCLGGCQNIAHTDIPESTTTSAPQESLTPVPVEEMAEYAKYKYDGKAWNFQPG